MGGRKGEGRKSKKKKRGTMGREKKVEQKRAKQIKISTEWKKEICLKKEIYIFLLCYGEEWVPLSSMCALCISF
jgi:hypothetical protein